MHPNLRKLCQSDVPLFDIVSSNGKVIETGWYFAFPETTYCLGDENSKVKLVEGVATYRMTDWGLPNQAYFRFLKPGEKLRKHVEKIRS